MPDTSEASSPRSALKNSPGFGGLAHRISGWTTNSLAVATVLAIGLALGWQLTSWWSEKPLKASAPELTAAAAGLPAVGQEREFWTSGGLLKVQRQAGGPDDAIKAMRAFCREKTAAGSPRAIRKGEADFVAQLLAQQPLEESPPIALYQPPGQAAMVVAVDREARQIVSWSFALPASDGYWSLYHFRPK